MEKTDGVEVLVFEEYKCDVCGEVDILREEVEHGMRKEDFAFVDCEGIMRRVEREDEWKVETLF